MENVTIYLNLHKNFRNNYLYLQTYLNFNELFDILGHDRGLQLVRRPRPLPERSVLRQVAQHRSNRPSEGRNETSQGRDADNDSARIV